MGKILAKFFQPAQSQMGLDAGIDFFELERFCHVVHSAHPERSHLVDGFVERADENNGNLS